MMSFRSYHLAVSGALALLAACPMRVGAAEPQTIVLASTTSVENSGLLARILPRFTKETGIEVHVIAQGTGQALRRPPSTAMPTWCWCMTRRRRTPWHPATA